MAKELIEDLEGTEDIRERRKELEKSIASMNKAGNSWHYSEKGLEARNLVMSMISTRNGMYARIPLVCKGHDCPYAEQCQLLQYEEFIPIGEYCPVETSQIELRVQAYSREFDIDDLSFTDEALLNEIVTLDIMLERCKALMAKEGTPVTDIVAGIAENGVEIRQPSVSKAWEAYEKISKKRDQDYQLMLMTRKDRKKNSTEDSDSAISQLIKNMDTVDITPLK